MSAERPNMEGDRRSRLDEVCEGCALDVLWPCESTGGSPWGAAFAKFWFRVHVLAVLSEGTKRRYALRFDDGGEASSTLRRVEWRLAQPGERLPPAGTPLGGIPSYSGDAPPVGLDTMGAEDNTGFVHSFELGGDLLAFCDDLHENRERFADTSRGDAYGGEPLSGGLVSVVIRRDRLPALERQLYNALHLRCVDEVPVAWPGWLQAAAGRQARARPSQDLRLLQYSEGANFKAHVDSGWACQALVYLNGDFKGGGTAFPNLHAHYQPRRGRVLMWRSVCVGKVERTAAATVGASAAFANHPALHMAEPVTGGVKRVVSLHLVLA